MLVQPVNAVTHRFRKAQRPRDVRSAGAARDDHFLGDGVAIGEDVTDRRCAAVQRPALRGLAEHEMQRRREARPDRLIALFEGAIVGCVKLADARRVAAAAEVLEQQGVIKIVELGLTRPIAFPIWNADPAARTQWPAGCPSVMSRA